MFVDSHTKVKQIRFGGALVIAKVLISAKPTNSPKYTRTLALDLHDPKAFIISSIITVNLFFHAILSKEKCMHGMQSTSLKL